MRIGETIAHEAPVTRVTSMSRIHGRDQTIGRDGAAPRT